MTDCAIKVENLGKRYRVGLAERAHDTLIGTLNAWVRSPLRNFRKLRNLNRFGESSSDNVIWALKDLSFEITRGEVVGVIGQNGAGKSTLLKVLSQITEPTDGRAIINGRVASLLEVGTGFHSELTGRENIYLNGTVLGMSKAEVDRKFDEIIAFSGVERFLDTPVKRYSSGMKVRLAFAVAAHLEPEILLIDEVLAVGDIGFQKKCLGKMEEVAGQGRTVLFVSHDMAAVQHLCNDVIFLHNGRLALRDTPSKAIEAYIEESIERSEQVLAAREDRKGTGAIRFERVQWMSDGQPSKGWRSGAAATIIIDFQDNTSSSQALELTIGIDNELGVRVAMLGNSIVGTQLKTSGLSHGRAVIHIDRLQLKQGTYRITLCSAVDGELADWVDDAVRVDVEAGNFYGTGKLPPESQGSFLMDYEYDAIASPDPRRPDGQNETPLSTKIRQD